MADQQPNRVNVKLLKGLKLVTSGVIGNLMAREVHALVSLAIQRDCKTIFEFGTFEGCTTVTLALNIPDAHIWTLDLEEFDPNLPRNTEQELPGTAFAKHGKLMDRITVLKGDSRTFDYSGLPRMDMAFIDGGHDYDTVANDTRIATDVLDAGLLVWHDFGNVNCPELTEFLLGHERVSSMQHIVNTRLVYLCRR